MFWRKGPPPWGVQDGPWQIEREGSDVLDSAGDEGGCGVAHMVGGLVGDLFGRRGRWKRWAGVDMKDGREGWRRVMLGGIPAVRSEQEEM